MTDDAAYYYSYFVGHGRELLSEELHAPDPLSLSAAEIVERVIAAGYVARVEDEQRQPFPTSGRVDTIDRDGIRFIVSVALMSEAITVQEQRAEAYERAE